MIDLTRFDSDDERIINALTVHTKSGLCSQCPLQNPEEEDCTFPLANGALKIIENLQKEIEDLEERIAIMSESDITDEIPFYEEEWDGEPCEDDEYV